LARDVEAALPWLESAVRLDPELDVAWLNLGVGLRRALTLDRDYLNCAEHAYRKALELNPNLVLARDNLTALMDIRNRLGASVVSVTLLSPSLDPQP
jgi:Flp pilus assembly protein TadD